MAKTYVSAIIDAPLDTVWTVLRDFRRLPDYHSSVVSIEFPGDIPGDQVGCVRSCINNLGMRVVEQLVALSDLVHTGSYRVLEVGVPVTNFVGNFRLAPVTDGGGCFIEWISEFDYHGTEDVTEMISFLETAVYMDCLNGLKRLCSAHPEDTRRIA